MHFRKVIEIVERLSTVPNAASLGFFLLILLTAKQYGFFSDELYYFACSKHLAFGYVDHPPLIAVLTLFTTKIFGESIIGLRFVSGIMGALTVFFAAQTTKTLGGGKFAQSLTALSICFASAFPALSSFFSMNSVDIMLCTLFILFFLKTINKPSKSKWIILGLILGIGLLNKYTFLVLGFSLLVSILITKQRKLLKSPWIYVSGVIGIIIFLPHIIWQIQNNWPTLEFMHNATEYKHLSLSSLDFFLQILIGLNPISFPIWLTGLFYLLFNKNTKEYRFLGITVFVFLFIYLIQNSKFYYVVPIFPLLLSAGSITIENYSYQHNNKWLKWLITSILILSGLILMPLAAPVLPVKQFITYSKSIGLWNMIRMEKNEGDALPLHYAYRFGWEELVDTVANAYNKLPQGERQNCAILASWYGVAGAIDHFGVKYNLPVSICGRNSYWIWGIREYSGETVLSVGFDRHFLEHFFNSIEKVAHFRHPFAYDQEIFLCKKPKAPLNEMWVKFKNYI